VAFGRAVAEADHDIGGALEVIGGLLHRLGGDVGDARIRGLGEPLQHRQRPGVVEELAHHGVAEITVRALGDQEVPEIPRIAQIGEVIGAAPLALDLAREAEPELGLADQVERGVGERDVLFENRRVAAPLADPVAEDQRGVAEPAEKLEQRRVLFHHIAPTSSGMSKKVGCR
jgi:hypothetical protein